MKNIKELEKFLFKYIPQQVGGKFPAEFGLKRSRYFLQLLGNPQEKIKIIHLAGTSGKGSTAFLISSTLTALGFKTGLHLSPHLLDIKERCQINNKLLTNKKFIAYLQEIIPTIKKMEKSKYGSPTYFEIMTGLAFYIFAQEKVDYAVMETGLGGTYDATNVVKNKNKIVVLAKIGKDHTRILGKTIKDIASQKVGIIQKNNIVISARQNIYAKKVIDKTCFKKKAKLYYVEESCQRSLSLKGFFQKENCAVALKTISLLAERDRFALDEQKINKVLKKINFLGRFDVVKLKNKIIILDGAHNPQKMSAFIRALKKEYPNKQFHFLLAFKQDKNFRAVLKYIIPVAQKITITNFFTKNQDLKFLSAKNTKIVNFLKKIKYKNYEVIENSQKAFKKCSKNNKEILVITGSLYLLSEIYSYLKK